MRESRDQVDFVLYLPDPLFSELSIERRPDVPVDPNVGEMFMEKENWPELVALTSIFSVELPGIEPAALPGLLPSDLPVRYVSMRLSTSRYLRIRSQVLTASRALPSQAV